MKRTLGLAAAAAALLIPLSLMIGAGTANAEYRPECETAYQAGKPVFDPMIANAKPATGAIELALCGENRHS